MSGNTQAPGLESVGSRTIAADAAAINLSRVSWGAIFAGVVVALVVQVLLTMLGLGIGIATLDPGTGDNPAASTFSIGAGIWYVLSGVVAAYVGGYIAARMSGEAQVTSGALHGLTSWAVATLLVLYFLTSTVGAIVGGAFAGLSSIVGGVSQTVAQTAAPLIADANPLEMIEAQVRGTGTDPESLNRAAINAVRNLMTSDEAGAQAARDQAVQALSAARGIPIDQATQQIAGMEQQFKQTTERAAQQAAEAADATASVVSTGAILAFFALVLGAVAAWFGGRTGVGHIVRPHPVNHSLN